MCKVSVIIPVYNVQKYLRECLNSVIGQTLEDIEILCVDDASTDGSLAILRKYEMCDSRIHVIDLPENRGQAAARNCGLQKACGEYIYFLDADDMLSDWEALELLYYSAVEKQADGVFFDSKAAYESEELQRLGGLQYFTDVLQEGSYSGREYFCRQMEARHSLCCVWRQLWKRSYLIENKLLFTENIAVGEDLVFSFQAIVSAEKLVYLKKVMHVYRIRENSSTTSPFGIKQFLSYCRCLFTSLRFIEQREPDLQEQIAFYRYLAYIRTYINDNTVNLIRNGENLNQAVMGTGRDILYLRVLLLADYPYLTRLFTPEEYQRMKSSKMVVVYGAGKAGQDVELLLHRFGIENYQVAVTKKTVDAPADLHEIAEFAPYGKDCFVIVAVTQKYRREMESTLDSLGLVQHISLEDWDLQM